ncbi:hypothetical protein EQW76_14900 [Rhizobium sp. rho-13.1]|nr:hypothetical protein EQW76_14900 [Rhizobium sp. rho-13.1]TQY14256.1 hypothetical protein EQW74_13720 [Rhizobium sp. rho-1.1]
MLSALETSTNPDEQALLQGLIDRQYLLWIGEKSAAVTHNVVWDNRLVCQVYLAAGDLDEILNVGINTIEEWAKSKGCEGFVLMGRTGWKRVLEARDFKFSSIVMFKEF